MKHLSIPMLLGVLGVVVASATRTRPWELVLQADPLDGLCEFVSFRSAQVHKDLINQNVVKQVTPVPHPGASQSVLRLLSHDVHALVSQAQLHCTNDLTVLRRLVRPLTQVPFSRDGVSNVHFLDVDLLRLELIPLITSGPAENRVDLAFFGDGYIAKERDKFLDDAFRLARDLSTNQTSFTVKPLLNFWASGTGVGGKAKDTSFGLYRDGTELRGLYANKSDVALAACASLGDKCDYAILLATDPLYGGLGGEYTTTTASLANGALVLRHEIGHSIIQVGEEYDGGFAYFGVNAIHDSESVTWAHWLTHQDHRVERSVMLMQAYPWTLLDVEKPWSFTFVSSGTYARHIVKFSLSGIPHADDLVVYLDRWTPRKDRWYYDLFFEYPLREGEHVIELSLRNKGLQGRAQLCSVEVLEFNATRGYYSLFPTYDLDNGTSYRPTNDDCLMRTVARPNVCNVCLDGLWHSLLKRIDLIDNLRVTCPGPNSRVIQADLVKLAQFRVQSVESVESYTIVWTRNGRVLEAFTNLTEAEVGDADGTYRVDVAYAVDQVRLDPLGYLHESRTFNVTRAC